MITNHFDLITTSNSTFLDCPNNTLIRVTSKCKRYSNILNNTLANAIRYNVDLDNLDSNLLNTKEVSFSSYSDDNIFTFISNFLSLGSSPLSMDLSKFSTPLTFQYSFSNSYSLNSVYDSIQTSTSSLSPYPKSVRYVDDNVFVIERPPFKIPIDFKPCVASRNSKPLPNYDIWIPWTITVINRRNLNDIKIFFSDKPLESFDSVYIPPTTPNSYSNGSICFSNSLTSLNVFSSQDISTIYPAVISEYFSGGWNLDLSIYTFSSSYNIQRQLRNTKTHKDFIHKKYPTLYNFTYPSIEYINAKFPGIKPSEAATIARNATSYSASAYSKYYFKMMSAYSLSETLAFHKELKECMTDINNNSYTFSKVLQMNYPPYHSGSPQWNSDLISSHTNYSNINYYTANVILLDSSNQKDAFLNQFLNEIDPDKIDFISQSILSHLLKDGFSNTTFFVDIHTLKVEPFSIPEKYSIPEKDSTFGSYHSPFESFYNDFLLSSMFTNWEKVNDTTV